MIKLQTAQQWNDSVDFANCLWVCYTYLYLDFFNFDGMKQVPNKSAFFLSKHVVFSCSWPKSLTRNVLQKSRNQHRKVRMRKFEHLFFVTCILDLPTPSMPMANEGLGLDHHTGAGDWVGGWTKHITCAETPTINPRGISVTFAKFWSTLFQH